MSYPYQKHIWVTKEVIRREYLQNIEDGIYDEQQERLLQEGLINDAIIAEENRAKGAEQTLTNNLSAEVTRAQGAESTLSTAISDEVRRAQGAESELATDITNLGGRVTDESTRALAAESALSTSISNEVTRAQGVESTLSTQITNEVNRATAAEADLRAIATRAYKASGSVYFADLPALDASRQGNVYDIKDAFVTTYDFVEGAGKSYPAGTNVAIVAHESQEYHPVESQSGDNPSEEGWYEFDGADYELSQDTTVDSSKTYYKYAEYQYKYDVESGFVDLSNYVQKTDKATTSQLGLVKPDGITTFVDSNGVMSSLGGGQGSAEAAERMIAPIEPDATASIRPYSIGDRLILDEVLYDVTQAIAVNDALVVGTNITASDSIVEQIAENTSDIASLNEALTNEVTTRAKTGAHNLYDNKKGTSSVVYNVQFQVNPNKSVSTTGASSSSTGSKMSEFDMGIQKLPEGINVGDVVTVSGCPANGGSTKYFILLLFKDSNQSLISTLADYGNGNTGVIPSGTVYWEMQIRCYYNISVTGLTFYPMIRLASDPDSSYQPYAMTNRELTKESEVIDNSANLVIDTTNFNITGLSDQNTLFKVGNIVEVNIVGHCKSSATNTTILLATIPEGYRPRSFPSISSYSNGAVSIGIDKYTGTLTIYSAQSQENWVIRAHFTYVCQ